MNTSYEPRARDYIESAKEANRISGMLLPSQQFDTLNDEDAIRLQYSLGLTFHAAELAGKAILRSLGVPQTRIHNEHRQHKLDKLWESICEEVRTSEACFELFTAFRCSKIKIDGKNYRTTNGKHLAEFLPIAKPRMYLYPDSLSFKCPDPLNSLFIVVNKFIEVADKIEEVLAKDLKDAKQ